MSTSQPKRPYIKFILGAASAISLFALVSCGTVNRLVVAPPQIPGAKFVGSAQCAQCHSKITRDFSTATHALLKAPGTNSMNVGCESCHGPGSIHVETGGNHHTIINPRRSPEVCFKCHLDVRGQFELPHSHPVLAGKISCADCHNPHKGPAIIGGGTALNSANETCFKCHIAQRGPFVFEHEALREGCTTCHNPHGSVNNKMLRERNQTLCLQCHFQQQRGSQILIGGKDHSLFLQSGTCWSAGCHEAIHGSQVSTTLRF